MQADLTTAKVAKVAGCHPNTVLNYERKGLIQATRDINNFRRFSIDEALKLKGLLEVRN